MVASVNLGNSSSPFVFGSTFVNPEKGFTDIHLKSANYRSDYLNHFITREVHQYTNKITGLTFPSEQSCLQNLTKNFGDLLQHYVPQLDMYENLKLKQNEFFKSRNIAVARVPLKEVTQTIQVG